MGQQIALQCAASGFDVVLHDVSDESLERSMASVRNLAVQMTQELGLPLAQAESAVTRIQRASDPATAGRDVDLLSESVPEDMRLKRQVFGRFNELCPEHTLFTSNTSTLIPSELAKSTGRARKFAVLHFHPNVWTSSVVDVSAGPATLPETIESLRQFAIEIGQIPIVLEKEHRGFVMNRFLFGIFRQALAMASGHVATPEDVDRSFMGVLGADAGPFALMDRVGLDTMLAINTFWRNRLLQLPRLDPIDRRNRRFLQSYVDEGKLGIKSGEGFYSYPDPAWQRPEFLARKTIAGGSGTVLPEEGTQDV